MHAGCAGKAAQSVFDVQAVHVPPEHTGAVAGQFADVRHPTQMLLELQ